MNVWKIAFFSLAGLIAVGIVALMLYIDSPGDSEPLPSSERAVTKGSIVSVKASRSDLEALANNYIQKAMKDEPIPVTMIVTNDVVLYSELTVFGRTLPFIMHFDPDILDDGNLMLKQTSMEIGNLNMQPSAVLQVLRDSVKLPEWMIVRPKEEEIFIHLTELEIPGNLQVRAKSVDLANDNIELEVTIPNN
ncbi:hypothetical protein SLU01_09450 [Sporosarcina luteola]|uniref:DUF2140 domain-containing protein n=1 Tax=Sporosarcina luteola TaxID=582850 RepID=A0A511Z5A8_9BACL|nr:YpmS family protein [Sporosarcina luteola]GEN82633.1 hypothetical protein SLU01_09450 [Sporosarcina luteola]